MSKFLVQVELLYVSNTHSDFASSNLLAAMPPTLNADHDPKAEASIPA